VKSLAWESSADLDSAILELDEAVLQAVPISLSGSRLIRFDVGDRVVVVGHPLGGALSFSLSESAIVDISDQFLHYRTPTEPGSSGSPVFDVNWDILAFHHAAMMKEPGWTVGEGIRASALVAALEQHSSAPAALGLDRSQ
jgi:S1-C subfamily serine protease